MEQEDRLDKFERRMERALSEMAAAITQLARFEERVTLHAESQKLQGIRLGTIERDIIEIKTNLAANATSITWSERFVWLLVSGTIGTFFFLIR